MNFFEILPWKGNNMHPLPFSSPDPKGHMSFCHHFASVVRPSTITKKSYPLKQLPFLFLVTAAMLVEGRDSRTQLWKWIAQGQFHQSLVLICQVVSEDKIF
jgi:hypothetical protein